MNPAIKNTVLTLTRGQLMNYAAVLHGQPTPYPAAGPGRHLQVRPDDTFIVSYPRSGNTWLRFLCANLVHREVQVDYANIETFVPDIYVTSELALRASAGPRVLKSHEAFDPVIAVSSMRSAIRAMSLYLNIRRCGVCAVTWSMGRSRNSSSGSWRGVRCLVRQLVRERQ